MSDEPEHEHGALRVALEAVLSENEGVLALAKRARDRMMSTEHDHGALRVALEAVLSENEGVLALAKRARDRLMA